VLEAEGAQREAEEKAGAANKTAALASSQARIATA